MEGSEWTLCHDFIRGYYFENSFTGEKMSEEEFAEEYPEAYAQSGAEHLE